MRVTPSVKVAAAHPAPPAGAGGARGGSADLEGAWRRPPRRRPGQGDQGADGDLIGYGRDDMPEFVRNRVGMQDEHLRTIRDKFGDGVRAVVPLFDQEVRGTAMLAPAAGALFD